MELASATILGQGSNLRVQYGDDRGLLVEFSDDVISDEFQSIQQKRPIFKTVPFISIIFPGDKTKRIYKPARDGDKLRFAAQWAAYEKGQTAVADGTPITEWPYLSKSQALELKHMGFYTVELLAGASDTQISNLVGGMLMRNGAQEFLKGHTKADQENAALKAENASMKERLDALEARFNDAPKEKPEKLTKDKSKPEGE